MKAVFLLSCVLAAFGCKPKGEEQPESAIASSPASDGRELARMRLEGTWQTECIPPFLSGHPEYRNPKKVGAIKTIQLELNILRYKVNFYDNSNCTGGITSQASASGEAKTRITDTSFTAQEMGLNEGTNATDRPVEFDVDSLLNISNSSRPAEWYYSKIRVLGDHLFMSAQISPNMGNTAATRSRGFPYAEFHYRRGVRHSE